MLDAAGARGGRAVELAALCGAAAPDARAAL